MNEAWLDRIYKEESTVSSDRRWLETKFWSLLAIAVITLFRYTFQQFKDRVLEEKIFQEPVLLSVSISFLIFFWLCLVLVRIFSRSNSKLPSRIKNARDLKLLLFSIIFSLLVIAGLHAYIWWYIKNNYTLINYPLWLLLFPIFILFALIARCLEGIISPYEFESLQVHWLSKEKTSTKAKFWYLIFFIPCLTILVWTYIFIYFKQRGSLYNAYLDFRLAFLAIMLVWFAIELIDIRKTIDNLPDLKELKFKLMSGILKDDEEILEAYEELCLGKDALRWLKDKCRGEKDYIENNLGYINSIREEIKKFVEKKEINGHELQWIDKRIDTLKSSIEWKKEDLEDSIYINILNLDSYEISEYKKFYEKEMMPSICNLETELKKLKKEFDEAKPLLKIT